MTQMLPCPACGTTAAERTIAASDFTVWRCAGCGLGRTLPPPPEADGREHFAEDAAHVAQGAGLPKDRWWRRFTEGPLDALVRAGATPGMRLLDVGCNVGYFLGAARERGFAASGFDGSSAAVAFARAQGLDVACARLETAVLDPTGYDVVVMNHILEHLPDPAAALRRVRDWVRPDGFVMVTLPNFASPIARRSGLRWAGLVPTQHVWHFTPRALARLVKAAGFERIRWETRMLTYAPSSPGQWLKWASRRALEAIGRADNLILVARAPAGRAAGVAQRSGVR
ncbi:MAG TPA: class I SAM-dependent methyltransferase [Methylomirabilota bacterium]|jgi:2-polyprenyl-3-methyl-5-hydroxy-6-metoxy-1,4-benzoquinol methylase|nr:class I SAM-dependent methyltransferase [Methylomirabilota bacterium]